MPDARRASSSASSCRGSSSEARSLPLPFFARLDLHRRAERAGAVPPPGARGRGRLCARAFGPARAAHQATATSASVSRTDRPLAAMRCASFDLACAGEREQRARVAHVERAFQHAAPAPACASSSRRSRLVTAARERPTASAACSCVMLELVDQALRRPCASSSGFRSSRWMFSISASASAASSGTSRTSAGTSSSPAMLRRAPAALAGDDLVAAAVDRAARGSAASRPARGSSRRARRAPAASMLRARLVLARADAADRQRRERVLRGAGVVRARAARRGRGRVPWVSSCRSHRSVRCSAEHFAGEREVRLRALRGLVSSSARACRSSALRRGGRCAGSRCDRPCRRSAARAAATPAARACCAGRTWCAAGPRSRARGLRCARTFLIVCTRSDSPSSA